MIALQKRLLFLCLPFLAAGRLIAAGPAERWGFAQQNGTPAASGVAKEESLPKEVVGFQGKVTGTVVSVDAGQATMKVKVSTAEAHAANNKATKPEALHGMTITVAALEVKPKEGPAVPDEKTATYIKGAQTGDAVSIEVRTSSKGGIFRLLKVPTAGKR